MLNDPELIPLTLLQHVNKLPFSAVYFCAKNLTAFTVKKENKSGKNYGGKSVTSNACE